MAKVLPFFQYNPKLQGRIFKHKSLFYICVSLRLTHRSVTESEFALRCTWQKNKYKYNQPNILTFHSCIALYFHKQQYTIHGTRFFLWRKIFGTKCQITGNMEKKNNTRRSFLGFSSTDPLSAIHARIYRREDNIFVYMYIVLRILRFPAVKRIFLFLPDSGSSKRITQSLVTR